MLLGLDIGGTKCAVTTGISCGGGIKITGKHSFKTPIMFGCDMLIDKISCEIEKLFNPSVKAIGISCGGPLDSDAGVILSPPNLPGWDDIPITEALSKRFKVRAAIQNDANACALAEHRYGAGRGSKNMIFLTFGTGMGAGLILNGELYNGANNMAGEIGHVRMAGYGPVGYGKSGSFEGFCSGGGIAQLGRDTALEYIQRGKPAGFCPDLNSLHSLTAKGIAEAANAGDEAASLVYKHCGKMLGRGLSIIIDILNPERIIIGSIFTRSEHLLREAMERELEREALSRSSSVCAIMPAALGEEIGNYAALAVAHAAAP